MEDSKCDGIFFLIRASKEIQGNTVRVIESDKVLNYLRVWATGPYETKVFVGINRKGYNAWKLMLQTVGCKPVQKAK